MNVADRHRARAVGTERARRRRRGRPAPGRPSPAGEHVARLPPMVAALRICGDPTVRAAWASAGSERRQRLGLQLGVGDAGAEAHAWPPAGRGSRSAAPGRDRRRRPSRRPVRRRWASLTSTIRSVPPASTSASGWRPSAATASSSDVRSQHAHGSELYKTSSHAAVDPGRQSPRRPRPSMPGPRASGYWGSRRSRASRRILRHGEVAHPLAVARHDVPRRVRQSTSRASASR